MDTHFSGRPSGDGSEVRMKMHCKARGRQRRARKRGQAKCARSSDEPNLVEIYTTLTMENTKKDVDRLPRQ